MKLQKNQIILFPILQNCCLLTEVSHFCGSKKVEPCIDFVNNRLENLVATEHLNLTGLFFPPVF